MFARPPLTPERFAGLAFVILAHGALLGALWSWRVLPPPALPPVFVEMIVPRETPPPAPARLEAAKPAPAPVARPRPLPVLATPAAPELPAAIAAPEPVPDLPRPPAPAPVVAPAPVTVATPAGPVRLGDELSLACPDRTPPQYPAHLRRRGVEGSVTVRVELDEQGGVASALVDRSSGAEALDAAALAAVRLWRCQPPQRGGRPVRALAAQTFNFTLEGR